MEERNTKVIICFTVHASWVASINNRRDNHKGYHLLCCTLFMGGWHKESKRHSQRSSSALLYTLHGWLAKRMEERNTKFICFTVHTSWVAGIKNWRDNHKGHHLLYCTRFMDGWQREWKRETQRSSCALLYILHGWLAKRMEERNTKVIICFTLHASWVAGKENWRENHKGHHLICCTCCMGGQHKESKRPTQRSSCALLYTLHGRLTKRKEERNTKVILCFAVLTYGREKHKG